MADAQLHQDLSDLTSCIKTLSLEVNDLRRARPADHPPQVIVTPSGSSSLQIFALVCSICAAFMAGAVLVGGLWMSDMSRTAASERTELRQSVNANKAYLSAIFQRAPELKDQIDRSKEQAK